MDTNRFQSLSDSSAGWLNYVCIWSMGFFIPLSTTMVSAVMPIVVFLLWIKFGGWRGLIWQVKNCRITKFSLGLFCWMAASGLFWGGGWESLALLKKYRELLLIPILISLMAGWGQGKRQDVASGLIYGLIATLIISILQLLGFIPLKNGAPAMSSTLTQAALMSWAMFWALHQYNQSRNWMWLIGAILLAVNATLIMNASTGIVLVLSLLFLFTIQMANKRVLALAVIIIFVGLGLAYLLSPAFKSEAEEVRNVAAQVLSGKQPEPKIMASSTDERYQFLYNGLGLFFNKPLIGHGFGNLESEYDQLIKGTNFKPTTNLHNEYLMIGAQAGMIGLFLLGGLMWALYKLCVSKGQFDRWMIQGLLIWMTVGCCINSVLMDAREGMLFAFLVSVYGANNVTKQA